ncbi:MAG: hypothetical protein ISR96_10565 [Nitrospira sp.]|nr:hypothetical protein [Nitrospira sp.]
MKKAFNIKLLLKSTLICLIIIFPMIAQSSTFHDGGAEFCAGCHTKSNLNDIPEPNSSRVPLYGPELLGSDPSSTCLRCHAKQNKLTNIFSMDGSSFTPGGDFYWMQKSFSWSSYGEQVTSGSDSHGHNIVAADYGLTEDSFFSTAPGGNYPSSAMGCTSCHDPHARTGSTNDQSSNFRLLGGIGYSVGNLAAGLTFVNPAPIAAGSDVEWEETDINHTAYGSGMSKWCANCHGSYASGHTTHPTGSQAKISPEQTDNYNTYRKTGDKTGDRFTSYLALVPFETGEINKDYLDPHSTSGPGLNGQSNVMCLTCHRSHASAFSSAGRWDFNTTFMADSHPQAGDSGLRGNESLNSYYGRDIITTFGKYQRQLCNKCHALD